MKIICKQYYSVIFAIVILILAIGLIPTSALAWSGGGHYWATEAALRLFGHGDGDPAAPGDPNSPEPKWSTGEPDPTWIDRDRYVPLYPELGLTRQWYNPEEGCCEAEDKETHTNWEWVWLCAKKKDEFDGAIATMNHFWYPEEGLHECPDDVAGRNNAWEEMLPHWNNAIFYWWLGDIGAAYANLGYAIHLIQDPGQPAHANEDMHPSYDCLEEWMNEPYCIAHFKWEAQTFPAPYGDILWSPKSNEEIISNVLNATWPEADGDYDEHDMHSEWGDDGMTVSSPYNSQQLFYMMYFLNQIGGYFASDEQDGNTTDPTGWLGGFSGFPTHWPGSPGLVIQDDDGLDDNDDCGCCDDDKDLSTIFKWAYGSAFRTTPAIIDLFRRTVDNVPPVTTVELSRSDMESVKVPPDWNNWPVTVELTGATDYGNPGFPRMSGLWKVWGECDGVPPANPDAPSWGISVDGKHKVECMSTDWCGNVEQDQDVEIWIDMTPPEVTFPDLRPNYLTSESFTATWNATDELSGVASEVAYLDGNSITKGQVFDLALLAGLHTLRVIAYDYAGNWSDNFFYFEVWIDADGWCFSVLINDKTKGRAMSCVVEFPAPYDIGIVDLTTSTLAVKGTLDLTQSDPIIGETAELQTQLLTGVGDHDEDGIPDRMLQFNKEMFVAALSGQTGDIGSIISGGLLPSGQPRFIAEVTVPVFKSTKK